MTMWQICHRRVFYRLFRFLREFKQTRSGSFGPTDPVVAAVVHSSLQGQDEESRLCFLLSSLLFLPPSTFSACQRERKFSFFPPSSSQKSWNGNHPLLDEHVKHALPSFIHKLLKLIFFKKISFGKRFNLPRDFFPFSGQEEEKEEEDRKE